MGGSDISYTVTNKLCTKHFAEHVVFPQGHWKCICNHELWQQMSPETIMINQTNNFYLENDIFLILWVY